MFNGTYVKQEGLLFGGAPLCVKQPGVMRQAYGSSSEPGTLLCVAAAKLSRGHWCLIGIDLDLLTYELADLCENSNGRNGLDAYFMICMAKSPSSEGRW